MISLWILHHVLQSSLITCLSMSILNVCSLLFIRKNKLKTKKKGFKLFGPMTWSSVNYSLFSQLSQMPCITDALYNRCSVSWMPCVTDALDHRCSVSLMSCVTDAFIQFQCLYINLFLFLGEDIWSWDVSHNTPFTPDSFACKYLFVEMRFRSGLRPMVSTIP